MTTTMIKMSSDSRGLIVDESEKEKRLFGRVEWEGKKESYKSSVWKQEEKLKDIPGSVPKLYYDDHYYYSFDYFCTAILTRRKSADNKVKPEKERLGYLQELTCAPELLHTLNERSGLVFALKLQVHRTWK